MTHFMSLGYKWVHNSYFSNCSNLKCSYWLKVPYLLLETSLPFFPQALRVLFNPEEATPVSRYKIKKETRNSGESTFIDWCYMMYYWMLVLRCPMSIGHLCPLLWQSPPCSCGPWTGQDPKLRISCFPSSHCPPKPHTILRQLDKDGLLAWARWHVRTSNLPTSV